MADKLYYQIYKGESMVIGLLQLMRIKHWLKNVLLFFPILFAGQITNLGLSYQVLLGFISFSLLASSMYCINDLIDVNNDRLHPLKQHRPLVKELVSTKMAVGFAGLLAISAFLLGGWLSTSFMVLLILYVLLNLIYNLGLKYVAILDATIISLGFVLRIFCGGVLGDISISHWLTIMTFLLAFLLAVGKRKYDLRAHKTGAKWKMVKGYSISLIHVIVTMVGGMIMVAYILYSISPEITARIGSDLVYLTSLPVFIGIMRYFQILIVLKRPADPLDLLINDGILQLTTIVWLISFAMLLYL